MKNKNLYFILIILAVVLLTQSIVIIVKTSKNIGYTEARVKVEKFINENLLPSTMKVNIKNITKEAGLYHLTLEVAGQEYNSYLSLDGKKFFQSGVEIAEIEKQKQAQTEQTPPAPASTAAVKKDKPEVELFVMSHCPYGLQIEKGIIPVLETLGNKIDFKLKFCSYAMHGKKELDEQLNQYCITKEEPAKLTSYLKCFVKDDNSASCLTQTGINQTKIKSCVSTTDKAFKITEKFNDQTAWISGTYPPFEIYKADNDKYQITGSPNLVINGSKVAANRDAASLLKLICSGFNSQPTECQKQLSSTPPSAGFGEGTGTSSGGGCAN